MDRDEGVCRSHRHRVSDKRRARRHSRWGEERGHRSHTPGGPSGVEGVGSMDFGRCQNKMEVNVWSVWLLLPRKSCLTSRHFDFKQYYNIKYINHPFIPLCVISNCDFKAYSYIFKPRLHSLYFVLICVRMNQTATQGLQFINITKLTAMLAFSFLPFVTALQLDAEFRFWLRLYLPISKPSPRRAYLCLPKLMQDLENTGFKLFTQTRRGQQKGWESITETCTQPRSQDAIWDNLCLSD